MAPLDKRQTKLVDCMEGPLCGFFSFVRDKARFTFMTSSILTRSMTSIRTSTSILKDRIQILNDKIQTLNDRIKILNDRIRILIDRIKILNDRIRILKDKIQTLNDRIRILENRFWIFNERMKRSAIPNDKIQTLMMGFESLMMGSAIWHNYNGSLLIGRCYRTILRRRF